MLLSANFEGYDIDYAEIINKGHVCHEQRRCWAMYDALQRIDNF